MHLEPNIFYFLESKASRGHYLKYVTRDEHGLQVWPSYQVLPGRHGAACIKGINIPLVPEVIIDLNLDDFITVPIPVKKQINNYSVAK